MSRSSWIGAFLKHIWSILRGFVVEILVRTVIRDHQIAIIPYSHGNRTETQYTVYKVFFRTSIAFAELNRLLHLARRRSRYHHKSKIDTIARMSCN